MSASTSVHSNAFNFSSYIQTGVDPRTGQYTVSIRLPELKGNDLQGPGFELGLFYSPLNIEDSGFGKGWNLQLTQVRKRIVTLSSGETYQFHNSSEPGTRLTMDEQKLRHFDLYRDLPGPGDAERYRVEHRSGLVEILQVMGSGEGEVALPVELHSPLGHVLYLHYLPFGNGHMLLNQVWDEHDWLLDLKRIDDSRVEIRCHPFAGDDGGQLARYEMTLSESDHRVSEIILPTGNRARWRFSYKEVLGYLCLSESRTPYGGLERVYYEDGGHEFPIAAGRGNLPRVSRHETDARFGQAGKVVLYKYPGPFNFLGGGEPIEWSDDGLDNLYKVAEGYTYQSIEIHQVQGQDVRWITRTFNRFHLLLEQATAQGDKLLQSITRYADKPGTFKDQDAFFQLPHEETQRWSLISNPSRQREERQVSQYDSHGNVLSRLLPTGVLETNVWYTAAEEGDEQGFVRNLKTRTVKPAAGQGAAPTLIQEYQYCELAPLGSALKQAWRLLESETLSEAGSPPGMFLERISRLYHEAPAERFSYGRISRQTVSYPGDGGTVLDTVTHYDYSVLEDERALQTVEKLVGCDDEHKTITLQHSLETGEPLLNRDDNDVEIRYQYDALRRVTRETVAHGKPFMAERTYKYFLCAYDNEQAQQWAYDVKQIETHTCFDGANRPIFEEREDKDSKTFAGASRPIYRALYDELDQLIEETEIDWLGDCLLELTRHIRYDDWGQQYSVLNPDGTTDVEQIDQVASKGGPVHRTWRELSRTRISGITETWNNLFEKPTRIERFALDGKTSVSVHTSEYDGLGRLSRDTQGSGVGQRIEEYRYDAFDRVLEHRLGDRVSTVYRTYAGHSRNDLPVKIKVGNTEATAKLLGEQAFDGLERRVSATTGGRVQTFEYDQGERQPHWVVAPDGTRIEYFYEPALGEEPVRRVLAGKTARYDFDPKNARPTHCEEPGDDENTSYSVDRSYFLSNGEVKRELRTVGGEPFTMIYDYSFRSRLRAYMDVLGQTQLYDYDRFGRLERTALYAPQPDAARLRLRRAPAEELLLLETAFAYDHHGRMASFITTDVSTGQTLATLLEYDEFDREILRTFDFGDTLQTLEQDYDEFDCLKYRILKERTKGSDEGEARLLRHETYLYDRRGRLQVYTCDGPEAPVDPSGQVIARQTFGFDGIDNIISVITQSPGGTPQRTLYEFNNPEDPAQLSKIVPPASQPAIDLRYDRNGNLIQDEQGRVLVYDALNRLRRVDTPTGEHCRYDFDPENILSGTTPV